MGGGGLQIPGPGSAPDEQAIAFAAGLTGRSGTAPVIEAALAHRTGRPRPLPVRAVFTALLCLALDDRPLFLTEVTRLLFSRLPEASRTMLGVTGTATTQRAFQNAYRRVRYCFHAILSVAGPSALPKNRRLTEAEFTARIKPMTPDQATAARGRLEALASARCRCSPAARPGAPACAPATPMAAGTSARATTATARTTRARRCGRSAGRWKPPSPPPPGPPARHPPRRTSRSAWPWPGPAKTPAAPHRQRPGRPRPPGAAASYQPAQPPEKSLNQGFHAATLSGDDRTVSSIAAPAQPDLSDWVIRRAVTAPMPWALGIWVVLAGGAGLLVSVTAGSFRSGTC